MSAPLAHSGGHLLTDHLRAVAVLAGGFSGPFAWRQMRQAFRHYLMVLTRSRLTQSAFDRCPARNFKQ